VRPSRDEEVRTTPLEGVWSADADAPTPRGGGDPVTEDHDWLEIFAGPPGEQSLRDAQGAPELRRQAMRWQPLALPQEQESWLDEAWRELPVEVRSAAAELASGAGATAVARGRALSVAHVRNLRHQAGVALAAAQRRHSPGTDAVLLATIGQRAAVPDAELSRYLPPGPSAARAVLLMHLGAEPPVTWAGRLHGFWTLTAEALDMRLRTLSRAVPLSPTLGQAVASRIGIDVGVPWWDLLSDPRSPVVTRMGGWVAR